MDKKEDSTDSTYTYILIGVGVFLGVIIAAIVAYIILFENKSKFGTSGSMFPVFDFNRTGDLPLLEF
jgi:hypothetical protein